MPQPFVVMGQNRSAKDVPAALSADSRKSEERDLAASSPHPLDSDKWQQRLRELMRWRRQARVAHADNREQMAIDEDYYDGIQFEAEDLKILADRGQPANYWNVVKNTINWILGTERRSRFDYRVLPRKKQDAQGAKTKTKVCKYIQDINRGEYARSLAFADAVKAGVGWIEVGVRADDAEEPIYYRCENWRNMWYDNLGKEPDTSDWRYVIREKWVDLEIAQAMFPERAESLEVLSSGVNSLYPYLPEDPVITDNASEFDLETDIDALLGGAYDGLRERVKLIEMWYRMPEKVKVLRVEEGTPYGAMDGVIYREDQADHQFLVEHHYATLHDAVKMQVRCAIWAGATYLQDVPTPYNHNRFPFIPIFCYRRSRDGMPYGAIRDLRSPQDDLNKRKNRALFLLSSNRFYFESGAINDPLAFQDEINRPDGMAEVNKGALVENRVKEISNAAVAMEHIQLAHDDERFIEAISGVTPQNKGQTKQELSGKAVLALQNQGQTTSGVYFDNYMMAFQMAGEILLSLIEQFKDREETIRITGDQQVDEFVDINTVNPDTGEMENAITKAKAHFVMSKQDYRETLRQSALASLGELIVNLSRTGGKGAEAAFAILDMYVDLMDEIPGKDEIVARIRKLNGQRDPSDEMTPEEKAQYEAQDKQKEVQQQKLQQLQEALQQANLMLQQGRAAKEQSAAQKNQVEATMKTLDGFLKALEVAGVASMTPGLVQAADSLIAESQQPIGGQ